MEGGIVTSCMRAGCTDVTVACARECRNVPVTRGHFGERGSLRQPAVAGAFDAFSHPPIPVCLFFLGVMSPRSRLTTAGTELEPGKVPKPSTTVPPVSRQHREKSARCSLGLRHLPAASLITLPCCSATFLRIPARSGWTGGHGFPPRDGCGAPQELSNQREEELGWRVGLLRAARGQVAQS